MLVSIRRRDDNSFRFLGAAAFFRIGFFAEFEREVAFLVLDDTVHSGDLFILAA